MENALVTIVCIALLLVAGLAMVHSTLSSVDTVSTTLKEAELRYGEMSRTEIALGDTAVISPDNTLIDVTVFNQGQEPIHDFGKWDIVLEYYDAGADYYVVRATYTTTDPPDLDNHWTNQTPIPATFEPEVLNPGEEMMVRIKLAPALGGGTDFLVVMATPNGVATSRTFSTP